MTATVHALPFPAAPRPEPGLNLSAQEVQAAAAGYVRPADQLKELHRRGFVRAYRRNGAGPVILERGHYLAVIAGQYGAAPAAQRVDADGAARAPLPPNRVGYRAKFGKNKKEG